MFTIFDRKDISQHITRLNLESLSPVSIGVCVMRSGNRERPIPMCMPPLKTPRSFPLFSAGSMALTSKRPGAAAGRIGTISARRAAAATQRRQPPIQGAPRRAHAAAKYWGSNGTALILMPGPSPSAVRCPRRPRRCTGADGPCRHQDDGKHIRPSGCGSQAVPGGQAGRDTGAIASGR